MRKIEYRVYVPGGNATALVAGIERDAALRVEIQNAIMRADVEIEQVGFVSASTDASAGVATSGTVYADSGAREHAANGDAPAGVAVAAIGADCGTPELVMTGGEFCGNAARSAAYYYLHGHPGELTLRVSGAREPVRAGVGSGGIAWAEIPMAGCGVYKVGGGMYWVAMEGISHLVISAEASAQYLEALSGANGRKQLLLEAKKLLSEHFGFSLENASLPRSAALSSADALLRSAALSSADAPPGSSLLLGADHPSYPDAAGVIFTERIGGCLKIHPCVFVRTAGTGFYETACGSGSVAAAVAEFVSRGVRGALPIMQPSGMFIDTELAVDGVEITGAKISGEVLDRGAAFIYMTMP